MVLRLVAIWSDDPDRFDGQMALRGVDHMRLPFHRWLNLVQEWLLDGADKKGRDELLAQLGKPPPGVTAEAMRSTKEWDAGAQGAHFMAALAARGGAGRVSVSGNRNVAT